MRHATETYRCTLFKKSKCSHFACVDTLFLAFLPISTIHHSLILPTLVGLRPVCQPLAPRWRIKNVWLRTSIITGLCEKFLLASYSSEVITIRPNSPHSHAGLIIQGYKDPIFLTSGSKCFRRVESRRSVWRSTRSLSDHAAANANANTTAASVGSVLSLAHVTESPLTLSAPMRQTESVRHQSTATRSVIPAVVHAGKSRTPSLWSEGAR